MKNLFRATALVTIMSSSAAMACGDDTVSADEISANNARVASEVESLKSSPAGQQIEEQGLGEFISSPILRCGINEVPEQPSFIPSIGVTSDFMKALSERCVAIDNINAETNIGVAAKALAKEGSLCDMVPK